MANFPSILKIGIVSNVGIFNINKTENGVEVTDGLELKFLQLLSEGLKFQYVLLVPDDMEWGSLTKDGKWTGLVEMVLSNTVDIAVSKIALTYPRRNAVSFSYPYGIEDTTFATKSPRPLTKETAIIRPFEADVWLALLVTLILVSIMLKLIIKKKNSMANLFSFVTGSLLSQSIGMRAKLHYERILIYSWIFSVMFISYSYKSVLLSFLTVPIIEEVINNRQQLYQAVESGSYKCYTYDGSSLLKSLLESNQEKDRILAHQMKRSNWLISPTKENIADLLKKDKTAIIAARNDFKIISQDKVFISGDPFNILIWSIAVNNKFCCLKELDSFIHQMWPTGLHQKITNDFLFRQQLIYSNHTTLETSVILKLNDVSGAFIFLGFGYAISLIALSLEILLGKFKRML